MKILLTIGAMLCATTLLAHDIVISEAYALPAEGKAGAAFMVINNIGQTQVKLLGGTTDYAKLAEVHVHDMNADGVMSMKQVEGGLTIPAGQCVILARGGFHIMLMGLQKPLVEGEEINLTLNFEGTHDVEVKLAIDGKKPDDYMAALPEDREGCYTAMNHPQMKSSH